MDTVLCCYLWCICCLIFVHSLLYSLLQSGIYTTRRQKLLCNMCSKHDPVCESQERKPAEHQGGVKNSKFGNFNNVIYSEVKEIWRIRIGYCENLYFGPYINFSKVHPNQITSSAPPTTSKTVKIQFLYIFIFERRIIESWKILIA